jgi:16S rRNA (uracil1498-N3)-methyltransferase
MSKHRRFFVDPSRIVEGEASIVGDAAHQITNVLRLTTGDRIVLLDGSGCEHEAELTALSRDCVRAWVVKTTECDTEPSLKLTLAVCLPKGDKLDLIVQKCTELGISRMIAVNSERTVARIDPAKVEERLARWRRIAAEAAEQAGRAKAPEICGVLSYEDLAAEMRTYGLVMLAWEDEQRTSLREVLAKHQVGDSVMLIVGPEGGLTDREVQLARDAGARCVSLGRRTLRCETAAIAACAAIMYEIEGEL